MRVMTGLFMGLMVLGLAFWAYQENYRTREALSDVRQVQSDIGALNESLTVLRAEWAFLNRPERLSKLAGLNFERLGLLPMTPDHFGRLDEVAYPQPDPAPMPMPDADPLLSLAEPELQP